jgi:hypothetical protein
MWLVHPELGFFSVVQKQGDTRLTIRARFQGDLERLRDGPMPDLGRTAVTPPADYRFRAVIGHDEFASGLAKIALLLDYDNVKARSAEVDGHGIRLAAYHRVWAALYRAQEAEPMPSRRTAPASGLKEKNDAGATPANHLEGDGNKPRPPRS